MEETGAPAERPAQPSPTHPAPPDHAPWQRPPTPDSPAAASLPTAPVPPSYVPPVYPPPSLPGQPAPFTSPPPKLPRWAVVVIVVVVVLIHIGAGVFFGIYGYRQAQHNIDAQSARHRAWPTSEVPDPLSPTPEASVEPSPTGPRASTYPVRNDDDLARVCDGWYYPQSPKFAGKAPHQISVGVVDSVLLPSRHILAAVTVPDLRESVWRAWIPENAAKTQLVACLDLTRSGSKLKSCKYDDPKPETVGMTQGFYRLRLYETATGKKLLDKPLTGEDEKCPSAIFLAQGEGLYSEVDDRQLYELLKGFVMRKV